MLCFQWFSPLPKHRAKMQLWSKYCLSRMKPSQKLKNKSSTRPMSLMIFMDMTNFMMTRMTTVLRTMEVKTLTNMVKSIFTVMRMCQLIFSTPQLNRFIVQIRILFMQVIYIKTIASSYLTKFPQTPSRRNRRNLRSPKSRPRSSLKKVRKQYLISNKDHSSRTLKDSNNSKDREGQVSHSMVASLTKSSL